MTESEMINGWTFEETVKTTENLMEAEKNIFKWDVLRHLRDFAENYKEELEQYRAIGTVEEFKALKEKMQDVEIAIIDRMQEFYDEYRSISQSSVDHFGGKADAIETSQKIVKGVFKDLLGLDWSEE